jgi:sialic acid synthase SpsE
MNLSQHRELFRAAADCGIHFLSTPFSPWAVELLEKVGVSAYKVASMDCTNRHLLGHIAKTGKPIYLSSGMTTLPEIAETLEFLDQEKSGSVKLLHCISKYPADAQDLNLNIIPFLKEIFNLPVGYSDHYPGTKACLAAAMLGADVIETHFTLDSAKEGGDHYHSVEPGALRELISDIELFQTMVGDKNKIFNRPDRPLAKNFRRGIYSARALRRGESLKQDDLLLCRPLSELSPNDLVRLMGRTLKRNIPPYQAIKNACLRDEE